MMPQIIGSNTRLKVAINAETSGMTFDGTPGTYDCMRIKSGGFKYNVRLPKNAVEEAMVFRRTHTKGGKIVTWTADVEWSYSYRELFLELLMGGAIDDSGASVPYTHLEDLVQKLKCGSIVVEYTDQAEQVNEVMSDTFANSVITALSLSCEVGGSLQGTISGLASAHVHAENVDALTTVQETEVISWEHAAITINGTGSYYFSKFSMDANAPMEEAPFGMSATAPAVAFGMFRKGPLDLTWSVGMWADSAVLAEIGDTGTDWTGANSAVFNNGGATTAEREFSIVLGHSVIEDAPRTMGNTDLEPIEIKLTAEHAADPELITAYFKNAREEIHPA